jgi:hypothetical protein
LTVAVAVKLPDVPVTVSTDAPVAAEFVAVRVSVVSLLVGFGLIPDVTPFGRPETENMTLPLKPFAGVMVIVLVPWPPKAIARLLGLAEIVKLGSAVTVRLILVVAVKLP